MRSTSRTVLVAATFAALVLGARPARAYNHSTHSRLVQAAATTMAFAAGQPPAAPAGVPADSWNAFMSQIAVSLQSLGHLSSDLGQKLSGTPDLCGWDPRDHLFRIGDVRISELRYEPGSSAGCSLAGPHPGVAPAELIGRTLGFHGASVDDLLDDSVLQVRLTNSILRGVITAVVGGTIDISAGALLLPIVAIYCVVDVARGHFCNPLDLPKLADQANPFNIIESYSPLNVGEFTSSDFVGVWHFLHVGALVDRFNTQRGMWYPGAGPIGRFPGVMDLAIMVGTDLAGLSLRAIPSPLAPHTAQGITNYGQYDGVHRFPQEWQEPSFGRVEFSPVDNLAKYGWDLYVADPRRARGLGWPLHALGDVAEPHHVNGTSSWGHRPFEDAAMQKEDEIFVLDGSQKTAMLADGFQWWLQVRGRPSASAFPVQTLVRGLAASTFQATLGADWPFDDDSSVKYTAGNKDQAIAHFTGSTDLMRPLLEQGVGAIIALLTEAGRFVIDPGPAQGTTCPPGTEFTGVRAAGNDCAPAAPRDAGVSCTQGDPCTLDRDCCSSLFCSGSTHQCTLRIDTTGP